MIYFPVAFEAYAGFARSTLGKPCPVSKIGKVSDDFVGCEGRAAERSIGRGENDIVQPESLQLLDDL